MKSIIIIGSGFASLSAACYLAQAGFQVQLLEKNKHLGGRARQLKRDGFTFDMGPTWYWMPDVFERFFADFNRLPSHYYKLDKLDPAYEVYFDKLDSITIEEGIDAICKTFEKNEPRAGQKLRQFIAVAQSNYEVAIKDLVYQPGESILELISTKTIRQLNQFWSTISKDVSRKFENPRLRSILEFPVLFLGAKPSKTPSFYSFMNYADFGLGTWHPKGGMFEVINAMITLASELGVTMHTDSTVEELVVNNGTISGVKINGKVHTSDIVISGADYHHTESLLPKKYRQYSPSYWENKTFAPSSLLFYVGFNKRLKNVSHHTLFFDTDFNEHARTIYDDPKWPKEPLFYASFPSITDPELAPDGKEAGIFLIPLAPGIEDNEEIRQLYFNKIVTRLEQLTDQKVSDAIAFVESFGVNDFIEDYNSYKGNAYGLANTLIQTAFLRPKLKSKKVNGLYFTGQLTVPGPGVPPSLISGKLVATLIDKYEKKDL